MEEYVDYEEAKRIVRGHAIKSPKEYAELVKQHPELRLPPYPDKYYSAWEIKVRRRKKIINELVKTL
jgi:hypothetical protein